MPAEPPKHQNQKPRMSKTMFTFRKRTELRRALASSGLKFTKDGKIDVAEFEGRKIVRKKRRSVHPNLAVHVKAIKIIWNELVKIWNSRMVKGEPQLYSTRFFDLAVLENTHAIYEHAPHSTVEKIIWKNLSPSEREKVKAGYQQLEKDFYKANLNRLRNNRFVVTAGKETYSVHEDFAKENVLFEGFDEHGRPKFILMDVTWEG